MRYLNDNYIKEINENEKYFSAISKIRKEVDEFSFNFHDDPSLTSEWGHNYFCDYDGGRLIFDINKPHEHKCSVCGKVFSNEIYDGVWVYFYRNQAILTAWKSAGVYAYTKDKKYLDITKNIIRFYAENYTKFIIHNKERLVFDSYDNMLWGCGRILPQGLNESIIAIRMIQALEIVKDDLDKEYLDFVYEHMFKEMYLLFKPQVNLIHNIRCWNNCALGLIGLFFDKKEIVDYAFNGPYNIRRQINEGVTDDGFWYEGSIHYNFFTLEGITPLILFSKIYNYDFGKKEEEIVHKMFVNAYNYAFDNQYLPNPNDGWPNINLKTYSYIYHVACKIWGEKSDIGNLLKNIENNPHERTTLPLSKPYYVDNEIAYERLLLNTDIDLKDYRKVIPVAKNFPKSNFATIRNDKLNVFVKYGLNGPSHSHPDLINIEIAYKDKLISRDLSNPGYRAKLYKEWHKTSLAHNDVVMNGQNITSTHQGVSLAYDKDYILTAHKDVYEGVDCQREVRIIDNKIIDKYDIQGDKKATYDYVFHFESDFVIETKDSLTDASLGFTDNGYQHIIDCKKIITDKDYAILEAKTDGLSVDVKIDLKNKELYLLKTMDNPVNKTRNSLLIREINNKALYKVEFEVKEG